MAMNEMELVAAVSQMIVADPVRIPISEFVRAYDEHRSVERQSPKFAALEAMFGSRSAALVPAIQRARVDLFFQPVWTSLLERVDLSADPLAADITDAVAQSAVGTHQAVLRASGFRRPAIWPKLIRAAKATALIKVDSGGATGFGTGFLVGPRLLMTAAHVVHPLLNGDGTASAGSSTKIAIEFHNDMESGGQWPKRCRAAENWLVAVSPPLGEPPSLGSTDLPDAPRHLDFALIRLAERIGANLGYLDIDNPPAAAQDDPLTVIGYPGGSDCLSDDHQVLQIESTAARVRHGANALKGMSGSPCIKTNGFVVAIHEGAVETPPPYNRAVAVSSIRAFLKTMQRDPLVDPGMPIGVEDPEARREWLLAGESRFADAAQREAWLASVAEFDPRKTPGPQSSFHPIFGRADLMNWATAATAADAPQRVAFVSGAHLSGKSFSKAIVANVVRQTAQQVIARGPEALRAPLKDVLATVLAEAQAQSSHSLSASTTAMRPLTGELRRDVAPVTLNDIESVVLKRPKDAQLLWLFLDFGVDANVTIDLATQWKEMLIQSAKKSWLRVMVIGLRSTRQSEFAVALPPGSTFVENIAPLTLNDFQACLNGILEATAPAVTPATVKAEIDALWDEIEQVGQSNPADQAIEAVRLALTFRQKIRSA